MVIDVIDMTDPAMDTYRRQLRAAGFTHPILMYGSSNGISQMVAEVKRRARTAGTIRLLRLNGHGGPGVMGISGGEEADMDVHRADLSLRNIELSIETLGQLTSYFAPNGRALLLGCNVALDAHGRRFIQRLADIWHVPVTAGNGDETSALRVTSDAFTARPAGAATSSWRRQSRMMPRR